MKIGTVATTASMEVTERDKEVRRAEDRGISNILRKESCGEQGIMKDEVRGEDRRWTTKALSIQGQRTAGAYHFAF